ncbi:MAG: methionine biosynthesis protein MetW, partial [SAR86 cluster bacterium]|nr:methionine biosynthesis protein MetW [SAR86 cluster bacterium]
MNRSLETIVTEWVSDNSKVIDFGCGDGSLLKSLADSKSIIGYGVENDPNKIHGCIKNGISVVQQDIDQGLL